MQLTILGNNGPYPVPGGACSGYLVYDDKSCVQLDLGTGTLAALGRRMDPEMLDGLLFSHWHHDHSSDVLPLLYRLADTLGADGRQLQIYAPEDETSPEYRAVMACPAIRLTQVTPGMTFQAGELRVTVHQARHPVPAVMYRLEDQAGKVLCFTGDTNTVAGLEDFARNADLLLADGLFPEAVWSEEKPHLSAALAAKLAADAGAKQLVLTHFSPRFNQKQLLQEARAFYKNVKLAQIGDTYTV
ncbi:MAG: MBL fold metallo-hydrolase [Clostridia bacterium]|nr:MBL fold metallo-hydrolase [Clostridia bacterium]